MTTFGLLVTLVFDLLTLKSNQLISVPRCTKVVNLLKFMQAVYQISFHRMSGRTHGWRTSPENKTFINYVRGSIYEGPFSTCLLIKSPMTMVRVPQKTCVWRQTIQCEWPSLLLLWLL